jgi:hypothetical protein
MKEIVLSDGRKVTMREPLVRDMRAVESFASPSEKEISLISNLTGLLIEELDSLTLKEYGKLQDRLKDFL